MNQGSDRITGHYLAHDSPLRGHVRPGMEDYYDLYTVELNGVLQGVVDEYGTCAWASPRGVGPDDVERLAYELWEQEGD